MSSNNQQGSHCRSSQTPKEYPSFSWSHSRDRMLRECPRRYYWHYYQSHGGWSPHAPGLDQHAHRLKKLDSYDLTLGKEIHSAAADIAVAIEQGRPWPTETEIESRVREALRSLARRSTDLRAFRRNPSGHTVAHCHYYGIGLPASRIERLNDKITACVPNLLAANVWKDVQNAGPSSIEVIDELHSFVFKGTKVWMAPDLVYVPASGGAVLVDWKTGRLRVDAEQLALYGLYANQALGLQPPFTARLVGLAEGRELLRPITSADLQRAARRVQLSSSHMRSLLADVAKNRPKLPVHFPLTHDRRLCKRCNYEELCRGEIEASVTNPSNRQRRAGSAGSGPKHPGSGWRRTSSQNRDAPRYADDRIEEESE